MLILSRKLQETIMIGDDIKICVLSFDQLSVRLGIYAPRDIPVHRMEVYNRIKRENLYRLYDRAINSQNKLISIGN